ncbi:MULTISPECIES: tRNA (adenosine(37)-N6)-threonylcarbamoyltransferase complex ATPase subunit type 1 TsaE [unclassified Zunongwangia]|uniref:tRNA (adenosine(37)-N6)-threonylcarbamoyltransferase complex ATPase subunit type 1 TsaE n=1 Tax=unclassified Zunongwangia TaxID=2632541 RepID=UPI0022DE75CB|nr:MULTISPECIES: tRNA (adenosine(37)-N6)-threonylcarbamoyltransferase complex ATPase subunit type 1 TsaE [unclassified Zunongwangia]WBL23683.1 tRNA (adenosine(37)-N6)-threonylcarbamoyltransferase complex ATPase subunit type 1 TsaE [Zunongwangia sp. HRR-M8]WBL24373.1 tRNA (adenosine(37)-N6)-threonylcarbamoyltransferase complex ATPase subunit type 1 TsaE [Zunongwangia sp. HGR-M22]
MELKYHLSEIDKAIEFILKNTTSKTILFYGEMGAGKTTLIKKLVNKLSIEDRVSSPTFSLVNEYKSETETVFHFDFYRIDEENEAYDIGFDDYLEQPGWKFIEWPQKITNLLPEKHQKLELQKINPELRLLKLS